ncbi:hypothetical protein V498_09774 [Pseudogymnoascus sp. VKM F-4517 (FW-2822)]|nr:hypothetical protein V498_09774 [Pseudogymnoascus sp. VKM F-4517 (FW-2822)]
MASTLAKSVAAILSPCRHRKIAIIGLDDAMGIDLLKRLCGTIEEKKNHQVGTRVHTGTKSSLKCDFEFVAVEVGGCAPAKYHRWLAAQFHDADGFIWVIDSAGTDFLVESREEMRHARMGRGLGQGSDQPGVSPEAPWLVLVDFKQNPLSMAEATRQAEIAIASAGDNFDWTSRAVSTTTSEGLQEAMGWLYKKLQPWELALLYKYMLRKTAESAVGGRRTWALGCGGLLALKPKDFSGAESDSNLVGIAGGVDLMQPPNSITGKAEEPSACQGFGASPEAYNDRLCICCDTMATPSSSPSSILSSSAPFSNYREYVQILEKLKPEFKWLAHFLCAPTPERASPTNILILDSENGKITERVIPLGSLRECSSNVKTRIVYIYYEEAWSINRDLLDEIAFELNLPPYFLWQHFDHSELELESTYPGQNRLDMGWTRPYVEPSRLSSFEVGYFGFQHLSAILVSPTTSQPTPIICLLARSPSALKHKNFDPISAPGPRNISALNEIVPSNKTRILPEHFREELLCMTSDAIKIADACPFEYTCPWSRLILRQMGSEVKKCQNILALSSEIDANDPQSLEDLSSSIDVITQHIDAVIQHLVPLMRKHCITESRRMQEIVDDYTALLRDANKTKSHIRDLTNRHVSLWALRESRKSIEEAVSVKRLSQLAYLFLPLTFTSSLFSMNIRELKDNPISAFIITAIIMTLLSLVLWWILGIYRRIAASFPIVSRYVRTLARFALNSPIQALLLTIFAISHSVNETDEVIRELGLYTILLGGHNSYQPPVNRFSLLNRKRRVLGTFWRMKILEIADYTAIAGWQKSFFWQRIRTKLLRGSNV